MDDPIPILDTAAHYKVIESSTLEDPLRKVGIGIAPLGRPDHLLLLITLVDHRVYQSRKSAHALPSDEAHALLLNIFTDNQPANQRMIIKFRNETEILHFHLSVYDYDLSFCYSLYK